MALVEPALKVARFLLLVLEISLLMVNGHMALLLRVLAVVEVMAVW